MMTQNQQSPRNEASFVPHTKQHSIAHYLTFVKIYAMLVFE